MENVIDDNIYFALENVDDSNYIDKIINHFSYEDRLNFFERVSLSKNMRDIGNLKYVLTEDEVIKILKNKFEDATVGIMVNLADRKHFFCLLNLLSKDNKVKELLKLDASIVKYVCTDIFNTDELRVNFIHTIEKSKEKCELLEGAINSIIRNIKDFNLKLKCIDEVSNVYPTEELHKLIDIINEKSLNDYFNNPKLSDLTKSILILRCSNAQLAKEYFLKLNDDFAKVNASRRFSKSFLKESNTFLSPNGTQLDNNFSFEDIKYMLSSIKGSNSRTSMLLNYTDEIKYKFLPFLSEEEKTDLLISINDKKLLFNGLSYLRSRLSVLRTLTFYKGEFPRYSEEYNKILTLYASMYNINVNHLIELSKATSLEIVHYLSNKNIVSLLSMNDEDFNKFIAIFNTDNTKLSNHTLNNIFDTFANKSFDFKFEYIMQYYNDTIVFSKNGEEKNAKDILQKIFRELGQDEVIKGYTVDSLFNLLSESNLKALDDFYNICKQYTKVKKEKEVKRFITKFNGYLDDTFEVTSSIKEILKRGDIEWVYENYLLNMMDKFNDKEKQLLSNRDLFNKIYQFKLNPTAISPNIKPNMFAFDRIMDKFYHFYKDDDEIIAMLTNSNINKVHVIPEPDSKFLIDVMSYVNASELKRKILDNDDLYKRINECFKKYGFLAFNKKIKAIQYDADAYCDPEIVSSILLNYEDIIEGLHDMNTSTSMISILDSADTYSESSKVYKCIFKEENFRYITLNPAPNRGKALRSERREESVINYIKSFYRERVAVPSFDEVFETNGKKLNVVVGNFTNPINLTLGERTKSCMRIASVGDDLYHFCLNNDNAFHIVLTDPETGKFISRASGFRNGNTIFLNQLRESVSSEYDSEDLVATIKNVASKFIEMTKDSEHPIENVFISPDLAMEKYKHKTKKIGISNIFKDMSEKIEFYNLRPSMTVLLASSNGESYAPIKLGNQNVDYYPVQRDKVRLADNPIEAVNHIEAINQLLCGKRIEDIKLLEDEFEVCYYGEDWYVAIGKDGNILKKVMRKSKDFESAFKEMEIVLNNLEIVENIFAKNKL